MDIIAWQWCCFFYFVNTWMFDVQAHSVVGVYILSVVQKKILLSLRMTCLGYRIIKSCSGLEKCMISPGNIIKTSLYCECFWLNLMHFCLKKTIIISQFCRNFFLQNSKISHQNATFLWNEISPITIHLFPRLVCLHLEMMSSSVGMIIWQ